MAEKPTHDEVQDLYRQYGPALLAYGVNLLGERAAAEDVLHEVFLGLLNMSALPSEPRPYLFRAVRNRALNSRRGSGRMTLLDPQKWLIRSDTTMETAAVIERAMCELPPEQREVVVMKVWAEMTLEEIATVVELPLNTVASRYRYALSRMRQILKRD